MEDSPIAQTIKDILEIVTHIKDHTVSKEEGGTKHELLRETSSIKQEIRDIRQDIRGIKSTMVTKDYLDEKLGDLRGDFTVLIRKQDTKRKALVDIGTS